MVVVVGLEDRRGVDWDCAAKPSLLDGDALAKMAGQVSVPAFEDCKEVSHVTPRHESI